MKKRVKLLLFAILLLAGILRIYALDEIPISLYSDEVDVGYQAYSIITTGRDYFGNFMPLHTQSYADTRAPLYLYSVVPTVAIFGITPWGVRLPAAIFGILGVWGMFLFISQIGNLVLSNKDEKVSSYNYNVLALIAAAVLAISPWHIQFSRVAFDVTQLLFLLIFAFYFFFKSIRQHKYIYLSAAFFGLTLWSYGTAKVFVPMIIVALFILYKNLLAKTGKEIFTKAVIVLIVISLPIVISTLKGEAGDRIGYISVFTDPTTKTEVDFARLFDAQVRGDGAFSVIPKVASRVFHNKFIFWGERIADNYLHSLSFDFLFINGDPNLRHSINGVGQFYKIEAIFLLIGLVALFTRFKNSKLKIFVVAWILLGILPSAITRDGGNHATRLILILPPLVFLITLGIYEIINFSKGHKGKTVAIIGVFYAFFIFQYLHLYAIHNPRYAERRWSFGYKEIAQEVKKYENEFEKIIITNADEQPYILFASWYGYEPYLWQRGLRQENVEGFGDLQFIDKFYFGQTNVGKPEELWGVLDTKTLYIAASREIKGNLAMDPHLTPAGIKLLEVIKYPSKEPAFYLFAKDPNFVPLNP